MPGDPAILKRVFAADLLNVVTVKLPPFWPDNIKTWLIQSESHFCLKGIVTSQMKFDYVVQAMSQSDIAKVLDLIRGPPPPTLMATSRTVYSVVCPDRLCPL